MIVRKQSCWPALRVSIWSSFLIVFILGDFLVSLAAADKATKKDAPEISHVVLDAPPVAPPFYFEKSDVMLLLDAKGTVSRSENGGKRFAAIEDIPAGSVWDVILHPFHKETVIVWGRHGKHYKSADRGATWSTFEVAGFPVPNHEPISFHADDPDKIILNVCTSIFLCQEMAYYTLDGFKTAVKELRSQSRGCIFANSSPEWSSSRKRQQQQASQDTGGKVRSRDAQDFDVDRVVCMVSGRYSKAPFSSRENRMVISDNFFVEEVEPIMEEGRTVQGIVNLAIVKKFLVAAASAKGTDELALYVSDDASEWHRAIFPQDHRLEEDAYTILESTNYSIQVDVMTSQSPLNPLGVLCTSNSNGTYFTRNLEHTNRNGKGLVDFEKVSGIQGIALVNVVDNWEEVKAHPLTRKKIKTKISFDDGRSFEPLTAGKKEIQLHSVSDLTNVGRVFSSPAPGLLMAVGNEGAHLKDYEDGDLYVSDDAGLTWSKALKGSHKYEFGDRGAVLLAIADSGPTDELQYSIDHGKEWKKVNLGKKVDPKVLTTSPDSTSLNFFLMATKGSSKENMEHHIFAIDFADYHKGGKCKDDDFEKWFARVDEAGNPTCVMGHKQSFIRRKASAECFVDKKFEEPTPQFEACACTEADFECDYNFVRSEDGKECLPTGAIHVPAEACRNGEETYKGSSGFRLIPGNACLRDADGAVEKDKEVDRPCDKETEPSPPSTGAVSSKIHTFEASRFEEYHHLERTDQSQGDDETIVARTNDGKVYMSHDAGKTWEQIFKDDEILAVYPHQYMNDVVFFLTSNTTVHYSYNRGFTFGSFQAPAVPSADNVDILGFHPNYKDWLIWTGSVGCESKDKSKCHNVAFFSEDRGATWEHRLRYVKKCEFIKEAGRGDEKKLLYCEQFKDERLDGPLQLKWSDNWFAEDHEAFGNIIDFATMSEFIVVASRRDDDPESLSCHASVDGKTFADAQFPPSFHVDSQKAYTVLDSSSHAVFLHVTVNDQEDSEYGSIIKSNSNGTSYVMSLNGVNRNRLGFVDFEKMLGIEGVILVNVVDNMPEADQHKPKRLRTLISHNDGAHYAPLRAPKFAADGAKFDCDISDPDLCSLHLHSYTERSDKKATFSSPSAVGLMIGVGNVGQTLTSKSDADTFMTRDGGVEWHSVKKGSFLWEFGDQGSIVVIVPEGKLTKSIFYSLDEGQTWIEYEFGTKEYMINSISTAPSDKSRNFVLWASGEKESQLVTINLDFTGLTDQLCKLDENNPDAGDYYLWEPRYPSQDDNCFLGHVAQYHRKRIESDCYNGREIERLHRIARNCSCSAQDFECDYNFELAKDGSCQLVQGADLPDHSLQCKENPDLVSYHLPTGYRRLPLDTCQGGRELEFTSAELPCPKHESDFEQIQKKQRLGGLSFFLLAIVLPFSIAGALGYWVYRKWDGKFGRIRLGESSSASQAGGPMMNGSALFDANQPWLKYPILALSGVVAVAAALPFAISTAWRSLMTALGRDGGGGSYTGVNTYASRSDFARGSRYSVVDPDEDELLGDDEDDEGVV